MKALVTGGGGFLGRRIVELLRERGDEVVFLARRRYPELAATGAKGLQVDLRDRDGVTAAVDGCDAVFHVAAKTGHWGPLEEFRAVNVDGTRNLLDAMVQAGVGRIVCTSTPSVHGYDHDIENGGQDLPYATTHESPYAQTKAEAERMVLAANGRNVVTVVLRPHLIFGPRDATMLPRVLSRARDGRLAIVGSGINRVDMTYVDNAAWAHLDAADALVDDAAACAGKAYFISNDQPVVLWEWLGNLCERLNIPRPSRKVRLGLARALCAVIEAGYTCLPLSGEPPITRFLVAGLAYCHWYDMGPAKRDLGYRIRVPMDEATDRTVAWLRGLRSVP